MMPVDMICTAPVEYRQVTRAVGDRFEVDDRDVLLLRALGVAVLANGAEDVSVSLAELTSLEAGTERLRDAVEAPVKRKRGRPRKGS